MTFLPIVQRELRVAANRRNTLRVRWWTTLIALGMSSVSLAFISLSGGRNAGAPMFTLLTGYAFGLCLLSGAFFAAHSLTEEKRQGTLGLLFLTDLKGYDVVLGKFAATSLNALYGLLALLPVTALPLLLGGVTWQEFWRKAAALVNAMFFSLAAGLCVSACMHDSRKAVGNTLGLVILVAAVPPALSHWAAQLGWPLTGAGLLWLSPASAFANSAAVLYQAHHTAYWGSLLTSHLLAWGLLGLASGVVPRTWQERVMTARPMARRHGSRQATLKSRAQRDLLSADPVLWLTSQELGVQWRAWGVVAVWAVAVLFTLMTDAAWGGETASSILSGYAVIPFGFLLKLIFALQAGRFFAEGRRNGTLELLLCTPLRDREIIRGQMLALWRSFGGPAVALVALLFAPVGEYLVVAVVRQNSGPLISVLPHAFLGAVYSVRLALDLLAICWVGMALALTMRQPSLAPALTILLVLILPSVLWWLDVLADLALIAWGASRCRQDLRRLLIQQYLPSAPLGTGSAPVVLRGLPR